MKQRLVLLGPPASGKGTLAGYLADTFGFAVASPGAMLRAEKDAGTEFGRNADSVTANGQLLDDDSVNALVDRWLSDKCPDRFVFDGFPRTTGQGRFLGATLDHRGTPLEQVIFLEADIEILRDRIVRRAGCSICGKILSLRPGQTSCECGGPLTRRTDDTDEVFSRRMAEYNEKTIPLVGFYEAQGLLAKFDATVPAGEVFESVKKVIL